MATQMRAIRLEANIYSNLDIFATKEDLKMFVFSYSSNDNVELSRRIEKISGPIKKLYRLRGCFCSLESILFFSVSFLFSRPSRHLVFNHQRAAEEAATASAAPVAKKSRKPKSAAPPSNTVSRSTASSHSDDEHAALPNLRD